MIGEFQLFTYSFSVLVSYNLHIGVVVKYAQIGNICTALTCDLHLVQQVGLCDKAWAIYSTGLGT